MSTYRPLYNFRIEHDYFVGSICRALQCAVLPMGQELMSQRGLLFRQTAQNEWTVLYDADSGRSSRSARRRPDNRSGSAYGADW